MNSHCALEPKEKGVRYCQSGSDGNCNYSSCPQLRDGEPEKTGRDCPLDWGEEEGG